MPKPSVSSIKGSEHARRQTRSAVGGHFKAEHPGTTFDIAAEGSTTGIAAIIDGTAGSACRAGAPNPPKSALQMRKEKT